MESPRPRSWWQRLVDWLSGRNRPSGGPDLPAVGEDGLLAEPAESAPGEEAIMEKPAGGLARWSKRDQTLAKLQEGYERVTQVVEEVQKHLAAQGERSERLCTSLEQLTRSMSELPVAAREQAQMLGAIAGHLETANVRTAQLSESMAELPKAARTQGEALSGIKRQLDMASEQNLVAAQTMEKLGSAVGSLGDYSHAQAEALREISVQSGQQNAELTRLVAVQSKRFVLLFAVTLILAGIAVAAAVIAMTK